MWIAKRWLQRFIGLTAFVLAGCMAAAQTVDFTATPTNGCSPLLVNFSNNSAGFSSNATYNWDFGNGNTSALKDSTGAQYKDERDYTVTLTVTDNGNTYTKNITVTVYKKPVVDFSVNAAKGCAPLPVTFTSNSTPGDGTIISYFWDFGDGATFAGTGAATHSYITPGNISPGLTVTNSYGCFSTLKQLNTLEVLPLAKPAFTALQTVLCTLNDPVTFINSSTGEGTLSYNWDFGDGNTSASPSPKHQYNKKGTYSVTLKVTNSDGCVADTTIPAYINAADYHADFKVPPVICENSNSTFTDVSTPQPTLFTQQQWKADNQVFYNDSAQFTYRFTAGQHTLQLIDAFGNCKDTVTKTITILEKPKTNGFVMDIKTICGAPATVQFKDTSRDATQWAWDVDNTENGNFVPAAFTQTSSYTYTADGTYYAWLRTTNAAGCTTEIVKPVNIQKISADIHSIAGDYGCDSLPTTFSATSSQVITTTVWNFGDNSPLTTDKTPKHVFKQPGDYQVTLNYTTANGCQGEAIYKVHVIAKPKFDFKALYGTTICGNTPVGFNVTGSNLEGDYYWSFGDSPGYYPGSDSGFHQYQYDSVFTVSLVITKDGCSDTVTKKDYFTILPPFPNIYSQVNTCEGARGLVNFQDATAKATEWSWNFGDGSPAYTYNSAQPVISHNFSKTGSYNVKLTTKNGSCTVSDSVMTFVLLKQSPVLTSVITELCGSDNLPVTLSDIQTNPAAVYYNFQHDFDVSNIQYRDSSAFAGSYSSPDVYWRDSIHLNLTDLDNSKKDLRILTASYYFNCFDTTNYIPIKIQGPAAGFEVTNNCYKQPFIFSDTSKGSSSVPVIKWEWNFGDGNTAVTLNNDGFNYYYENPGTYNVLLKVTDRNGCTDTAQQNGVAVNGIKAAFKISENPVVPGTEVSFINQSVISDTAYYNDNQFTWMFGDGTQLNNVSLDSVPLHSYAQKGVYTVMLIAKNNAAKCTDTAAQYLYIQNPNLLFTYTTEFINPGSGCPPMLATFNNTAVNTTSISWNFGDGTTAGNVSPATHTYNKPGNYTVTLYGYFNDDTVDSVFQNITIQGPYATLKADKQFACGAQPITLTAKALNATSYTWDFGDGTLTGAAETFAVHKYLTPGMYTPSLIVKDSNNCSFPFFLEKPIIIDTLHLAIHTKPAIVCDSSVILFTPDVVSVAKDLAKMPLQYHWRFGTGNTRDTSNIETPSFTYNKTGTYPVLFSAESPYGCSAETIADIIVNPTPAAGIKGPATLCEDDSASFVSIADAPNSTLTWEWHFPNGNIAAEQKPALQWFGNPLADSVVLILNLNGCFDTAYSPLTVFAKPVVDIQSALPQICAGQTIQLAAHDGSSYKWLPGTGINNNTSARPMVSPDSTTLYKVVVTNKEGCANTDSLLVRVVQRFSIKAPPLLYVCRGSTAQLSVSGADIYNWIEGTNLSNTGVASPVTSTAISQTYKVVGYDSAHCFTDTAVTEVRIEELPMVKAGADMTVFAGMPVTLTATWSSDVMQWHWQPETYLNCTDCPNPVSTPQTNMVYTVLVNNAYGCRAQDSLHVNVICKEGLIQIPSAFTPNGDGKNERFRIQGNGIKLVNRFAVFNRGGQLLFEQTNSNASDANAGWDGTFGGKAMAPGTYVFIAEIVCATGEVYHYKGTVVLIR